jgi:hypothetical protein
MSVVAEGRLGELETLLAARTRMGRDLGWVAPTIFAVANAITFLLVAPNVNDIWAALARQSAANNGVGLTYWFSWFGGGTTPGNYSVLTPYLSALFGAGPLGAVATTSITPLAWVGLRRTNYPTAGVWVATVCAAMNLWSGRVPFALGTALGLAALIAVMWRRQVWAVLAAVCAILASPVSAVFVGIALVGVVLTRPDYRRICLLTGAVAAVTLVAVGIIFGSPGPESFGFSTLVQDTASGLLLLVAVPPNYARATVWLTVLLGPALFLFPNGLGDNLQRMTCYCLPAVIIATSNRRLRTACLAVSLALVLAGRQTVGDLFKGAQETASVSYYQSLIDRLQPLRAELRTYRLEIVADGTHTASYALLGHAMLARGWEIQDDQALNEAINAPGLAPTTYKIWLQDNAVGYVAIAGKYRLKTPEYELVAHHRPGYLRPIWHDERWTLYQVRNPNPLVNAPVTVRSFTQSQLILRVPCACTFTVRVHWSKYLNAATKPPKGARPGSAVTAKLANDGFGWTTMTTHSPGTYRLAGSLTGGLLH